MTERAEKDPNATRERYEGDTQERFWDNASQVLFSNIKRTYDEYQQVSLDHIRNVNAVTERILSDAATTSAQIANQTIKHTSDTDAQKIRHADIAIENQWESAEEVTQSVTLAAVLSRLAGADLDDENLGKAVRAACSK
jgi:hypothetical protein